MPEFEDESIVQFLLALTWADEDRERALRHRELAVALAENRAWAAHVAASVDDALGRRFTFNALADSPTRPATLVWTRTI